MGGGEKGWKVRTALEGGETQGTLPAVRSERRDMQMDEQAAGGGDPAVVLQSPASDERERSNFRPYLK